MKKLLFFFLLFVSFSLSASAASPLHITEIMAQNGVFTDGENYDWIEIYNASSSPLPLGGCGLSDQKNAPRLWQFPEDAILAPGQYALIYCTGKENMVQLPGQNIYYASFRLAQEGETIYLSDAKGKTILSLTYPMQYGNISYGMEPETGKWGYFAKATPGKANAPRVYDTQAERPRILTEAGFYSLSAGEALHVALSSPHPIRYTLDGSEPGADSLLYEAPIEITKTTVLKARSFPENQLPSPAVGATFLINDPCPVPVISLSTDEKYLYAPETGLLVSGSNATPNYLSDWEYPVFVEYFDESGLRQIAQTASFRIAGDSSRLFPQKSLALFARSAYGDGNVFSFNPFPNRDYGSYQSLLLRSAATDYRSTRMKDAVMTEMSSGLGIMYQAARPVIVYINGEYAGHYNLREKINKHSVAQWEHVSDPDLIDQIELLEGDRIMNGSADAWLSLMDFVSSHDLSLPENLAHVQSQLDAESFFTWVSLEMCFQNKDLENVRIYRIPGGQWKYILYDVEGGAAWDTETVYMLLAPEKSFFPAASQHMLLKKMLEAPVMRDLFLRTFARVLENSFIYETTIAPLFAAWESALTPLLPRHFARYDISLSMEKWQENIEKAKLGLQKGPLLALDTLCELLSVTDQERAQYFGEIEKILSAP